MDLGDKITLEKSDLSQFFDVLKDKGYQIIGPTVQDHAIVYDHLDSLSDLPIGWTDEQKEGEYRLKKRNDQALFGYVLGPQSWKKFLSPPITRLWEAKRDGQNIRVSEEKHEEIRYAFIGVRSCEIHAIAIQDKILMQGEYVDPLYQQRRKDNFILAVDCVEPGGTCFCTSMKTGPKVKSSFDLALTELISDQKHLFVMEIGSQKGLELLSGIDCQKTSDGDRIEAEKAMEEAAGKMGRSMDTSGLKELLYRNYKNPHWQDVAKRCMSCTNCTMVCPTCFCSTVEDYTDLAGAASRWRKQDSCFTRDFTYIHGGSVRQSTMARYRHWLTHKLATWVDQFGSMGCVGCGRCITWCPVAIDITEETRHIRESEHKTNE